MVCRINEATIHAALGLSLLVYRRMSSSFNGAAKSALS
jgi:hypothetical protein